MRRMGLPTLDSIVPGSERTYVALWLCCCMRPRGQKSSGRTRIGSRLAKLFGQRFELVLPWGTEVERVRSEYIAAAVPGARVPDRAPLDQIAKLIAGAQFVVGVDTGLLHLAAALGVPVVAIFTGSKPALTGPVGRGRLSILGDDGKPPSVDAVVEAVENIIR